MILKDADLGLNNPICYDNADPPAYESIPHPDTLFASRWKGQAYTVMSGVEIGIFRDW
jgi:hypothetical protein